MERQGLRRFESVGALAKYAADEVAEIVGAARRRGRRAALAIGGGESPGPIFAELLKRRVAWDAVDLFWTDDRCVPVSDPRSNFGAARRLFLDRLAGPTPCSFPIDGTAPPGRAAADYDRLLRGVAHGGLDVAINGVGEDGHTAGLFPGHATLRDKTRWAVAVRRPDGLRGVTTTLPFLNKARRIWVVAFGPRKRPVVEKLEQGGDPAWPVLRLRSPLWLVSPGSP